MAKQRRIHDADCAVMREVSVTAPIPACTCAERQKARLRYKGITRAGRYAVVGIPDGARHMGSGNYWTGRLKPEY